MASLIERRKIMQLVADSGIPYTNNGLILWWDCEDFQNGDTTWTDRINSVVATEAISSHTKNADGSVAFADNGFTLPTLETIFPQLIGIGFDFTIECAMLSTRNGNNIFKYYSSASSCYMRLGGYSGFCPVSSAGGSRNFLRSDIANRKLSVGYTPLTCCANGVEQTTYGTDYNTGSNNGIGYTGGSTSFMFNGKIWSLRIYDRVLTMEEMQADAAVDNERFNLWT